MKAKQLKLTFLLAVLMGMVGANAFAHDIGVKNADGVTIYYTYMNNKTELAVSFRGSESYSYSEEYSGVVNIPESVTYNGTTYPVTSIGISAFDGCTGLTSVTIPNSVTSIGQSAFLGCSGLTEINVDENNTAYSSIDGVLFNKSQTELILYPRGKQGAYTIPNSVTSIGSYAFLSCYGLTSVTIPNSVTSIGDNAFWGCSSLTSVTIPNSVTSIGSYAFCGCSGLTSVTIPNSVTSIGEAAFSGCKSLTSVNIPNSVTSIGEDAFSGCSSLAEINVDENNTAYSSIDGVLFNKSQTELIRYPGGKQGAYTIPNSVTSIGEDAFYNCSGLTTVTIPNSVTSIGNYAFHGCGGLTSVNIPNSVTSIGDRAFYVCFTLTSVTIGNSVTSIGEDAFAYCIGLTSITIPNSVTSIGDRAFYNCSGLTTVTIPNSVTSIGQSAFVYCSGLTEINVDKNNTAYSSIDGVLFNKLQTELIQYPGGKQGAYTIPNSVTSIGDYAFSRCTGLTTVTIPNSVTSIGQSAFLSCYGLTSITIGNSVTSIGQYAFSFCSGLTSVTIPNSVTSIGDYAFSDCSGLTSVTIPNSVTSIGIWAFERCSSLTDIYCHIEEPLTIKSSVFYEVPTNTCTLHVPIGSKVKYQAADVWKEFLNIVEDLPTGIVSIDNSQLTIDNDVWFTLNGVRLNGKPTKAGIYIVNGKKVIIK